MKTELIAEMIEPREAAARRVFEEVVAFCRTQGAGKVFVDWPEEILRQYLLFHMRQRTLAFVRVSGVRGAQTAIAGVGILWRLKLADYRQRRRAGLPVFDWQPDDPAGDALYAGEWICHAPGALRQLVQWFKGRFPEHRRLTFIPVRRKETVYA